MFIVSLTFLCLAPLLMAPSQPMCPDCGFFVDVGEASVFEIWVPEETAVEVMMEVFEGNPQLFCTTDSDTWEAACDIETEKGGLESCILEPVRNEPVTCVVWTKSQPAQFDIGFVALNW